MRLGSAKCEYLMLLIDVYRCLLIYDLCLLIYNAFISLSNVLMKWIFVISGFDAFHVAFHVAFDVALYNTRVLHLTYGLIISALSMESVHQSKKESHSQNTLKFRPEVKTPS